MCVAGRGDREASGFLFGGRYRRMLRPPRFIEVTVEGRSWLAHLRVKVFGAGGHTEPDAAGGQAPASPPPAFPAVPASRALCRMRQRDRGRGMLQKLRK